MLLTELNSEFEILFEELATHGSKGLDVYEKSYCFTLAQRELVKKLANPATAHEFQNMVVTKRLSVSGIMNAYEPIGKSYSLVNDSLKVIDYVISGTPNNGTLEILIPGVDVPVGIITEMVGKDYKYPPKNLAYVLRVRDHAETNKISVVFAPFKFSVESVHVRYIRYPKPVILDYLGSDSIDGHNSATKPEIADIYKDMLLDKAVKIAISTYVGIPDQKA
jgi:hypothetical protein